MKLVKPVLKVHQGTNRIFINNKKCKLRGIMKLARVLFAVSTQEMAVTFPAHKVMHLDRRHRANPSNHAAQTTAHCSPEACCYSCCSITFSKSGAEHHSEYQKGRKAVLLILWKSSVRSNIHS